MKGILIEILRTSGLFHSLTDSQLEKVAHICREKTYQGGERVLNEGEEAKELYILEEGKAILEMKIDLAPYRPARYVTIEAVTKGDSFGLSALIPPHIFRFSVVCLEPCKVIAIDRAQLFNLLQEDLAVGYEVMKKLAELVMSRLIHTRQMLISERGIHLLSE